jgi:DNA modification methylase
MRLCCTATPAPNDIAEIANHAEFLGILSRPEMLARFFVHDDNGWRLKRHAREPFYLWLASWGMSVKKPSDIGFADDGFGLPALSIVQEIVKSDYVPQGQLFHVGLKGITDRSHVRRSTLIKRVERAADLINASSERWLAWVGLNDEGRELAKLIPGAVLVEGSQSADEKAAALVTFADGDTRVLITKPRIAGFGMNFQAAHKMAFIGLSDSYESYYQCIRRCWRFGQTEPVSAHIILTDAEDAIYENVRRKEREAELMSKGLLDHVREFEKAELDDGNDGAAPYTEDESHGGDWRLLLGDCVTRIGELAADSIDLSIFSPPFLSLYVYSPSERDMGNNGTPEEYFQHFGFLIHELLRVTKPGRNCAVHIAQVPAMLGADGYIGIKDFRGDMVKAFCQRGWVYHGEVCIDKDPQAQAIRTHSKGLLFVQLRKDSSWLRPALADYILVFRKPGDNAVPISPDITNNEWIEWARPIWYGIRESDTLNVAEARAEPDERHIVPLQLGTIERVIRLWSNEGESVLSPFAGIGSEGYKAIQLGRRFVGIELKPEYYATAVKNLRAAESQKIGRLC